MNEMGNQLKIQYYLVNDTKVICIAHFVAYLYLMKDGIWMECDYTDSVGDYLHGFDPSEPETSPYRYNNPAISAQIREISEEEVIQRIGEKALRDSYSLFKKEAN